MYKHSILTLSILATAALTQHRFANIAGAVPAAAATGLGVANADAAIGEYTGVDVAGTTVATAGAAIAKGALLEIGATGKVVTRSAGIAVGRALEAAGADGDLLEILLIPN